MKKIVLLTITISFLSGCYLNSSITSTIPLESGTPVPGVVLFKNTLEATSGASRYETTPIMGYKVRHSVGALFSKQVAKTPQGYKVYSQVQGRISADEDRN